MPAIAASRHSTVCPQGTSSMSWRAAARVSTGVPGGVEGEGDAPATVEARRAAAVTATRSQSRDCRSPGGAGSRRAARRRPPRIGRGSRRGACHMPPAVEASSGSDSSPGAGTRHRPSRGRDEGTRGRGGRDSTSQRAVAAHRPADTGAQVGWTVGGDDSDLGGDGVLHGARRCRVGAGMEADK